MSVAMVKVPDDPQEGAIPREERVRRELEAIRAKRLQEYRVMMRTGFVRTCPICDHVGEFAPVGRPPRLDGMCPSCKSRERHRLFKLWLDREKPFRKTDRLLHFAPERMMVPFLRRQVGEYVTADYMAPGVQLKLDITAMDLPDGRFDVVIAHQILEHVDHVKALAECFRVLAPGGMMVATTPMVDAWEKTHADPSIVSRRDRLLHFGQADHIRMFGRDLKDDMRRAGFALTEIVAVEPDVATYALTRGETLFILKKPEDAAAPRTVAADAAAPSGGDGAKTKRKG